MQLFLLKNLIKEHFFNSANRLINKSCARHEIVYPIMSERYKQKCKKCDKWFEVYVTTMGAPGCKEKEEVICPYCHSEEGTRMTDGFVYTYKVEPQPADKEAEE